MRVSANSESELRIPAMRKQKEPPCKKEVELVIGPEIIYAAELPIRGTKRTFQIQLVLINHDLGQPHNLFTITL